MKSNSLQIEGLQFLGCGPYSFSLKVGEIAGLSGASGVGKTQLLRALSDLIPSKGSVSYNAQVKENFAASEWRRMVTMIPTDSVWWHDRVGLHFNGEGGQEYLQQMSGELGFPPAVTDWQINRLSSGEKQRLALLRTLQMNPSVLLLDEPTSALDRENVLKAEKLIHKLVTDDGCSCLLVSHDMDQLERICDRLLIMTKEDICEVEDFKGE